MQHSKRQEALSEITELTESAWTLRRADRNQTFDLSKRALALSEPIEYVEGIAKANLLLGLLQVYASEQESGYALINAAFLKLKECNSPLWTARALNSLGFVQCTRGFLAEAINHWREGLSLSKEYHFDEITIFILYNIGDVYKSSLKRYQEARHYFNEAVDLLQGEFAQHPMAGPIFSGLSECEQQLGNYQDAILYGENSLEIALAKGDSISIGLCYQMTANLYRNLEAFDKALEYCEKSIEIRTALNDRFGIANVLLILADIHCDLHHYETAINYGEQSLKLLHELDSRTIEDNIYLVCAKCYEKLSDYKKSSEFYKKYAVMREINISKELENNINILTAEMKINEALKDVEIHRLKNIELKRKSEELSMISELGQKITDSLQLEIVMERLYERLNYFMDLSAVTLGIYHPDQNYVECKVSLLHGKSVECASSIFQEDEDLINECIADSIIKYKHYSNLAFNSVVLCPLLTNGQIIGFLSIRSANCNAYSDFQIDILQRISTFLAIAVNNAQRSTELINTAKDLETILQHLVTTQSQLIRSEKMAALGGLVAGVAHEINTPIGTSITLTSFIKQQTQELSNAVARNYLSKSRFEEYVTETSESIELISQSLEKAAQIVKSFKNTAVNQNQMPLSTFSPRDLIESWILELSPLNPPMHLDFIVECDENLYVLSYPSAWQQILSELYSNSIKHAFENTIHGIIQIKVIAKDSTIILSYEDNGTGISNELLGNVFDPFFTTKKANGGIGLGLHLVHNLVKLVLEGEVDIVSTPGIGTKVTLRIAQ